MPTPSLFQHVQLREPINADTSLPISPEELEFFAEQEPVTIIPNFSFDRTTGPYLECIGGTYGPFQPNTPVDVPLWLALTLYQRRKCRILPPDWMHAEDLRNEHGPVVDDYGELRRPGLSTILERERMELQFFQPLPEYYVEIAHILLRDAIEIFAPDTHKVKNLLNTLRAARYTKIESGLKKVSGAITVKLNNLSATECNMIRLLFKGTMNMYLQLGKRDKVWSTAAANTPLSL